MKNLGLSHKLLKHQTTGGVWRKFDISSATKVDPNTIDNGSTTVGGVTTLKISDGVVTADTPDEGVVWYIPTTLVAGDLFDVDFFIKAVNATGGAGGYGSAQGDNIFTWMGLITNPADILNYGVFIGREHAGSVQPRASISQGGVNAFGTANAGNRHVYGNINSYATHLKSIARADALNFTRVPPVVTGLQNGTFLPAAADSDPIYLAVGAGLAAPDTYEIPFELWYKIGQKLPS